LVPQLLSLQSNFPQFLPPVLQTPFQRPTLSLTVCLAPLLNVHEY
jgi:hypothetical protein